MAIIPKLALIPSGYKAGKIYSVLPTDGVGDFDFTRASSATRINSSGLIETVATGVPRLNYPLIDGVVNGCPSHLLEPTRSNLFPYSSDYTQTNWSKFNVTIESNSTISPDGTLNADKILEQVDSANGHFMFDNLGLTPSVEYNFSIFVKKLNRRYVAIQNSYNTANGSIAFFDLDTETLVYTYSNGTIGTFIVSDAKIEKYPNGWYRLSANFQSNVSTSVLPALVLADTQWSTGFSYNNTYTGDVTKGIYAWGAQIEQGSYATSYIPTSGSAVTRVAETATGSGDASTFNDSEGVLMAEINFENIDTVSKYLGLHGSTSANRVIIGLSANSSTLVGFVIANGSNVFNPNFELGASVNTNNKIALKYKENDFALWVNGIEVVIDNLGSLSAMSINELAFFGYQTNNQPFLGSTKQIQYFDSALNDTDLETLTSWTSFTDLANGQQYSIK